MSTLISPGLAVVEKDYSTVIPNVSSSIGAMGGINTYKRKKSQKLKSSVNSEVNK